MQDTILRVLAIGVTLYAILGSALALALEGPGALVAMLVVAAVVVVVMAMGGAVSWAVAR